MGTAARRMCVPAMTSHVRRLVQKQRLTEANGTITAGPRYHYARRVLTLDA